MVLRAALALLCLNAAGAQEAQFTRLGAALPTSKSAQLSMRQSGARIQRVDFVLDQASQPRADESQKNRKAEQRTAAGKPKPHTKNASEMAVPAASRSKQAASASTAASTVPAGALPGAPSASQATVVEPAVTKPPTALPQPAHTPEPASEEQQTQANTSPQGQAGSAGPNDQHGAAAGRPPRLTRDQLLALLPGSTMLRTNTAGALRQWVNKPDGTLTVYWGGGGFRNGGHSASGRWNVTEEGRLCLHIDWLDVPENWCRFLEPTANGDYQPIADFADANWTPPADKSSWRPLTIRH
jgi:hypothetical protein